MQGGAGAGQCIHGAGVRVICVRGWRAGVAQEQSACRAVAGRARGADSLCHPVRSKRWIRQQVSSLHTGDWTAWWTQQRSLHTARRKRYGKRDEFVELPIIRDTQRPAGWGRTCEQFRGACMHGVELQRAPQQTDAVRGSRHVSVSLLLAATSPSSRRRACPPSAALTVPHATRPRARVRCGCGDMNTVDDRSGRG